MGKTFHKKSTRGLNSINREEQDSELYLLSPSNTKGKKESDFKLYFLFTSVY